MLQITNPKKFFIILGGAGVLLTVLLFRFIWGPAVIARDGEITIAPGTNANKLWQQLVTEGYSNRALPWRYYSWRTSASQKLQAGTYNLVRGETVREVVTRFVKGDVVNDDLTITYPEGFTVEQIAARTAARGIGTEAEFIAQAKVGNYAAKFPFLADLPATRNLEGYLFPDTYRVFANDTASDVIERMLTNFQSKITDDMLQQAKVQNRSLDQIVIMASIIEREVNRQEDLAPVADVLWKRFDADTGLGADATVRYVLSNWDKPLTVQDLAIDSPYNTRRYKGLPPSAIGNPGVPAMLAALHPEKNDYYYYLSAPDGTTIFSKTNDEHNANKIKYLR